MKLRTLMVVGLLTCGLISNSNAASKTRKVVKRPAVATQKAVKAKQGRVNINRADAKAIAKAVNGIGKSRAVAIVAYRKQNGRFKSIDQLAKVKGISPGFIKKNRKALQKTVTLG